MSEIVMGAILLALYLISMVLLVQYKGDTSIANFTWGGGVLLVTLYTFFRMSSFLPQQILITILITLWALRLIIYLYLRYTGKDPRFVHWKWQGLKALGINLCWIFGQAIMIAIMSYPAYLINTAQSIHPLTWYELVAAGLWLFGFCFESISDYQLFAFLHNENNKGTILQSGLWRYSRHPNYFGETVMWWSIFCISVTLPYGWTTIIAPLTITFLLACVTGIPLLERAMANNAAYQEYKKHTSAFIPWFVHE